MTAMAIMIFAAGMGTRMRPLTATRPKPLIQVAGRALLDHALDLALASGGGPIVVNTHYLADQIATHLKGQAVRISYEPQLLETGGGLRAALPLLGPGPVMILNSDAVWTGENPLAQLQRHWNPDRMDGLLLTLPAQMATGYQGRGDFITDARGHLTRAQGRGGDVYLGAQILKPQSLHSIAEAAFSLNRVWDQMMGQSRLFGLQHRGGWCDVGRPDSLPLAEALVKGAL